MLVEEPAQESPVDTPELQAAPADSIEQLENEIKVKGEIITKLPDDLYIPPEALRVFLEAFQGPLDLLLYLIKKQNLDILELPIAEITRQYMEYVELMRELQLELASEYLVMAAMLAEIKSRLLLPRTQEGEEEEGTDPRAELVRRLQEYERYKKAAEDINDLPRTQRDFYVAESMLPPLQFEQVQPQVELGDILNAMRDVLHRAELNKGHQVEKESLSIRERMSMVLERVNEQEFTLFTSLFTTDEGRMGVVVSLIAILELTRQSLVEFVQAEPFAPIYVKAKNTVATDDSGTEPTETESNG